MPERDIALRQEQSQRAARTQDYGQDRSQGSARAIGQTRDQTAGSGQGQEQSGERERKRETAQARDERSLAQRWPEMSQTAERELKQEFKAVVDRAEAAYAELDKVGQGAKALEEAREAIDREVRGARRDVFEVRDASRSEDPSREAEARQRLSQREDEVANIVQRGVEALRTSRTAPEKRADREEDRVTPIQAAKNDLKSRVEAKAQNNLSPEALKEAATKALEEATKRDERSLAQRWPEMSQTAERELKQEFKAVVDRAEAAHAELDKAGMRLGQDQGARALEEAREAIDREVRGARRDVFEVRDASRSEDPSREAEARQRLSQREDEVANIVQRGVEAAKQGEKLQQELSPADLKEAARRAVADATQRTEDAGRPMQQDALVQLTQSDAAALRQRWPELSKADEYQLKQTFEKVSNQASELRGNFDELVKSSPDITRQLAETAREFVDDALRDARVDVFRARQSGGENIDEILQRMEDRFKQLEGAQSRLDQDVRESPAAASRQLVLEDASRSQDDIKKTLSEMNGYELERSEIQAFRRDAGLADEGLVKRPEEGELVGANVSMKKLIDNIEDFAKIERAGKEQGQSESQSNQQASSEERWQSPRRADEAALAERWNELTPAAERRLKEAVRDVGEQADSTRQGINEVADKQGGNSQRLNQMLNQVEEENVSRKAVADVRQNAAEQNQQIPREVAQKLDDAAKRMAGLERELDKIAGAKVRDVLEPSGLTESLDKYRGLLQADVEWKKAEADRAQANRETNRGGHELAREELRAAQQELKEIDDLLKRRISDMRPDLVEVRLKDDGRMRIDMTDFTHRVNSIAHTAKAHAYKEGMQQAFPNAEVSMFEYRSPTVNNHLGDAELFAEALRLEVEKRIAAVDKRRRENLH